MNNDLVTLKVDKFYNETCGDNYKDLYKDGTMYSNFNKSQFFFEIMFMIHFINFYFCLNF